MSDTIFLTSIFIFGTIVGSFLNVLMFRLGKTSFIKGRSICPKCRKKLNWYELFPIFSFIFLKGRCSSCNQSISIQYPIVEFFSGILFLLAFFTSNNILEAVYLSIMFSILLVIFFYDLKHKIIPDIFSYLFGSLAFVALFVNFSNYDLIIPFWGDIIAGPIFFLPFFALWFFSRGTWMGLGDAKLSVGIGWFLGLTLGFSAIILSFWIGAVVGLALLFLKFVLEKTNFNFENMFFKSLKKLSIKSEIPFGPFLIAGLFLAFYFNLSVLDLIEGLMLYN